MTNVRSFRTAVAVLVLAGLATVATARTWTSRDGKFTTEAELVDFKAGEVSLLKSDGSVIKVPLAKLSDDDQDFVLKQYPATENGEKQEEQGVAADVREWTSSDGKFTTRARFVTLSDGKLRLEKPDGQTVDVPLSRLCEADRAWVKDHIDGGEEVTAAEETPAGESTQASGQLASNAVEMRLVEMKIGKGNRSKPDARTRYILGVTGPQYFLAQSNQAASPYEERFKGLVKKEPTYEYKEPFRAVAIVDGEQFAFVLDATGRTPKGYDRLYVDLNRNGDLTDDKPFNTKDIEGTPTADRVAAQSTFDRVPVSLERDGVTVDHVFGLFVDYTWTPQAWRTIVQMRSLVYREGEIAQNGRKIPLLLIDRNSNGRFDDGASSRRDAAYSQISDGDLLLVNPKLHGSQSAADASNPAWHFVNKTICLEDHFYLLEISPFGDRVKLEPSKSAVGYVNNASPVYRAVVFSNEHGVLGITGTKDRKVSLPAGKWEIASYTVGVSDNAGTTVAASFQDKPTTFEVQQDSTTELSFGAPFRAIVTAARAADGKVGLSLSLVGQAGERCGSLLVGGQRPPAPKFEVRSQAGDVVYSGQFEYG